jgi:hypothetical protein
MPSPSVFQTETHLPNRLLRGAERLLSAGFDPEMPFRPAAALARRLASEGADVTLRLQPLERGMDGAYG